MSRRRPQAPPESAAAVASLCWRSARAGRLGAQSVHAVAAAKALAWEREHPVERAYVEYPTHGVVRPIELTVRRKARYRAAIRTLESIDGPPPRLRDDAKCESCEYAEQCGVRTRSLRSMLGFG